MWGDNEDRGSKSTEFYASLTAPEKFDWRNQNWEKWLQRWERYRVASNLARISSTYKVNMLIYILGGEADELLDRLGLSGEEKKDYETVVRKLTEHFNGKFNLVFERSKFFARNHYAHEPVEEFINNLHSLAKNCRFDGLKDELIMHKIIQGIQNVQLSESLQVRRYLTLKEVEVRVKQSGMVRNQQEEIRGQIEGKNLDEVQQGYTAARWSSCERCGGFHKNSPCTALRYKCNKCQKIGHFPKVCRRKQNQVREIAADDNERNSGSEYHLHSIKVSAISREKLDVEVNIGGNLVGFKIDTGADVSIISGPLYNSLFSKRFPLSKTDLKLYGAGRHPLQLLGKFKTTLSIKKGRKIEDTIYVIKEDQFPLHG